MLRCEICEDIIIGIICVLRPWFDCVDRHVYLLICVLRSNVFNGLVHWVSNSATEAQIQRFKVVDTSTIFLQISYFYRYHISTDIIFLQISTYYQDPYVGEGKLDPTEIGPNCCWANQFAQFVGWGGVGFSLGEANQFAQFVGWSTRCSSSILESESLSLATKWV